jgi:hypothetical protein
MRITKQQLKKIIKEELQTVLSDGTIGDSDYLKKQVASFRDYYRKNKTFRQQFRALSRLASPMMRLRGKSDMSKDGLNDAATAISAITPEMIRQDRTGATGLSQLLDGLVHRAEKVRPDPDTLRALQQMKSALDFKFEEIQKQDVETGEKSGQSYVGVNQVEDDPSSRV